MLQVNGSMVKDSLGLETAVIESREVSFATKERINDKNQDFFPSITKETFMNALYAADEKLQSYDSKFSQACMKAGDETGAAIEAGFRSFVADKLGSKDKTTAEDAEIALFITKQLATTFETKDDVVSGLIEMYDHNRSDAICYLYGMVAMGDLSEEYFSTII